jgi:hypothetical protein
VGSWAFAIGLGLVEAAGWPAKQSRNARDRSRRLKQQHPRRHLVREAEPERLKYQPVEKRERRAVFVARRGAVQHLRYSSSVLRQQPTKESIDE